MMKHLQKIYIWVMMPLFLLSCQDFLDITPEGQIKRDQLLSTKTGIEDALYGVYAKMRNESLYGSELSFSTLEILAQYMECYGNNTVNALLEYRYTDTYVEDVFEAVWTNMYNNISNVNSVLNCDLVRNATAFPYTIYKGEALGLRAFMHFDLLRLFTEQITLNPAAAGIPYATEFSLNTPDFQPAAKVYELILADLLEAERLLADETVERNDTINFMKDRQIHFNLYAVKATLARVYLTKGDKENALKYAKDVIEHSDYSLSEKTEVIGDLAGILSKKETIFGVYYAKFYSLVSPKLQQQITYSSLDPRKDIMTFYDNENVNGVDFRGTAYFTATSSGSSVPYRLSKLTDIYELQNLASNRPASKILGINLLRMPEMYYIAAECLLDTDYDAALGYFNEVLTHRGLEPLETWNAPYNVLTLDVISSERYKEFIGEGQTFFNMKRLNQSISAVDGEKTIGASNSVYVVPIPHIESDYRK